MTPRQLDTLKFIRDHMAAHEGLSPTYEEIRLGLGLASKSSVHRLVTALEAQELIRRIPSGNRSIQIAGPSRESIAESFIARFKRPGREVLVTTASEVRAFFAEASL